MMGSWTCSMGNFIDNPVPNAEGALMPQTSSRKPTRPSARALLSLPEVPTRSIASRRRFRPRRATIRVYCWSPASSRRVPRRPEDQGAWKTSMTRGSVVTHLQQPFSKTDMKPSPTNMAGDSAWSRRPAWSMPTRRQEVGGEVRTKAAKAAPAAKTVRRLWKKPITASTVALGARSPGAPGAAAFVAGDFRGEPQWNSDPADFQRHRPGHDLPRS